MKYLNLILGVFLAGGSALAQDMTNVDGIHHWKRDDKRIVYFVPRPELKVSLTPVDDSANSDVILEVEMDYSSQGLSEQAKKLERLYPGYSVRRVIFESLSQQIQMEIPALGRKESLALTQNNIGPYFNYSDVLKAGDAKKIKRAFEQSAGTAVTVSAQGQAWVPGQKVKEHVELNGDVCGSLIPHEMSVADLIHSQNRAFSDLRVETKYPETEESLRDNMLIRCAALSQDMHATSLQQLLSLKVKAAENPEKIVGEAREEAPQSVDVGIVPQVQPLTINR